MLANNLLHLNAMSQGRNTTAWCWPDSVHVKTLLPAAGSWSWCAEFLLAVYSRLQRLSQQQRRARGSVVCLKPSSNVSRFLIVLESNDKVVLLF